MIPRAGRNLFGVADLLTWALPALVVPGARFIQERPDRRNAMFVRDFSTYSLGGACYFLGKWLTLKVLHSRVPDPKTRGLLSLAGGVFANMGFAGFGAMQLSQWVDRRHGKQPETGADPKTASLPSGAKLALPSAAPIAPAVGAVTTTKSVSTTVLSRVPVRPSNPFAMSRPFV